MVGFLIGLVQLLLLLLLLSPPLYNLKSEFLFVSGWGASLLSSSSSMQQWQQQQQQQRRRSNTYHILNHNHPLPMTMVDSDHNHGTPISSSHLLFTTPTITDEVKEKERLVLLEGTRRKNFQRFQTIIESLASLEEEEEEEENRNGRKKAPAVATAALIWHSDREVNHSAYVAINSLLFEVEIRTTTTTTTTTSATSTPSPTPATTSSSSFLVIVIVPSSKQVDTKKLESYFEQQQQQQQHQYENEDDNEDTKNSDGSDVIIHAQSSLVCADRVEECCGFAPKSVPPIGHIDGSVYNILIDESLLFTTTTNTTTTTTTNNNNNNTNASVILYGGGGHPKIGLLIDVNVLLKIEGTEVVDVITTKKSATTTKMNTDMDNKNNNNNNHDDDSVHRKDGMLVKQFFPLAPPTIEEAEAVLLLHHSSSVSSSSSEPTITTATTMRLTPTPLTFVGRINGIRRMARRLVFVDISPADYVGNTGTKMDSFDLPWLSAIDQNEMSVQLICGKSFCKRKNIDEDDNSPEIALKNLRVGQLLLVEGKTNVGNRDSLQHWVDKRSFDLVLFNYRLLEEAEGVMTPSSTTTKAHGALYKQPNPRTKLSQSVSKKNTDSTKKRPTMTQSPENCLKLSDVCTKVCNNDTLIEMIDDAESLINFRDKLQNLQQQRSLVPEISTSINNSNKIEPCQPIYVGIDCEWKPDFLLDCPTDPQPVLLLQVSIQPIQKVFLFDLQALLRSCLDRTTGMNELERTTSDSLAELFASSRFLKIGYQVATDFRQLACSYPHIPAFQFIIAVMEVGSVAKVAMQLNQIPDARQWSNSLSKLSDRLLDKPLWKREQISDWSSRPLTSEQSEYAALDAAVLPAILEKAVRLIDGRWEDYNMKNGSLRLCRHKEDMVFARSVVSMRFSFLDRDNLVAIRKLKARRLSSLSDQWIVTQSWVTGREEPAVPSIPSSGVGPYVDIDGTLRCSVRTLSVRKNPNHAKIVDGLVGCHIGKSKDNCLEALLLNNPDVPNDSKLEYLQRSGYVEFRDYVALFVNMPISDEKSFRRRSTYRNDWIDGGRFLTWFIRENEWKGGSTNLASKMTRKKNDSNDPTCVLFVRVGKGNFICCGRCCINPPSIDDKSLEFHGTTKKNGSLVELQLELLDWPKLRSAPEFVKMVSISDRQDAVC